MNRVQDIIMTPALLSGIDRLRQLRCVNGVL
jgi:hypothetical protein